MIQPQELELVFGHTHRTMDGHCIDRFGGLNSYFDWKIKKILVKFRKKLSRGLWVYELDSVGRFCYVVTKSTKDEDNSKLT